MVGAPEAAERSQGLVIRLTPAVSASIAETGQVQHVELTGLEAKTRLEIGVIEYQVISRGFRDLLFDTNDTNRMCRPRINSGGIG